MKKRLSSCLDCAIYGAAICVLVNVVIWGARYLEAQQISGGGATQFFHASRLASDFTDGSAVTTLQNTPLVVTFPGSAIAQVYQVDCDLYYSQATNVADNIGVQFSAAPTNAILGGIAATNATAYASGTPPTITTTTATNVISMTPAVTTVLYAHLGGLVEMPSGGLDTTMTVQVAQATAADVIVVKRGSVCRAWQVQ